MLILARADARALPLASGSVQCCVTSPPYWGLRDYGTAGQLGLEPTPEEYVARLVGVFREVRRVLRPDGTLWLNLGNFYLGSNGIREAADNENHDGAYRCPFCAGEGEAWDVTTGEGPVCPECHGAGKLKTPGFRSSRYARQRAVRPPAGYKCKDLFDLSWMVANALRLDGWWLRAEIIWSKPNALRSAATDRPAKTHEHLFLLTKEGRYRCDKNELPGGSVWTIPTQAFRGGHLATFPEALVEPCLRAGSREGDVVLDPFAGTATVACVAIRLKRRAVCCDISDKYLRELAAKRTSNVQMELVA